MEPVCDPTASPRQLRKALEWELSLDARDLRSHAWYHGTIPRHRAEELCIHDGDFLVRDCISQPGDYVLTCRWKGSCLHFVINKTVVHPNTVYEAVQFCLEDDGYDSVADLVTCYVGSGKPLSTGSGARVSHPVNRSMPLSFYATRYASEGSRAPSPSDNSEADAASTAYDIPDGASAPQVPISPSTSSATTTTLGECVVSGEVSPLASSSASSSRHPLARVGSEPMLSPLPERKRVYPSPLGFFSRSMMDNLDDEHSDGDVPPPKPSRVPSAKFIQTALALQNPLPPTQSSPYYNELGATEESDSGNCSCDSVVSGGEVLIGDNAMLGSIKRRPQIPAKRRRPPSDTRNSVLDRKSTSTEGSVDLESVVDEEVTATVTLPPNDPPSAFEPSAFATLLLPLENKPLDTGAKAKVKSLLLECGARILANHLTHVDLEAMHMLNEENLGLGVNFGIELITLPQGRRLRLDLLERLECMKLFVAVSILTCEVVEEQALLLDRWIQIAIETKTALGNLYGFCGIMMGLAMDQVQRAKEAWHFLRRHHTTSALTYETKLRPTLKAMHEATDPLAPNTTIPHLVPLLIILEKNKAHQVSETPLSEGTPYPWDHVGPDYGLQTTLDHLTAGRKYMHQLASFRRNGQIALEAAKMEDVVLDAFRTEFHLRYLWGSRGASVVASERHPKFHRLLTYYAAKYDHDPYGSITA